MGKNCNGLPVQFGDDLMPALDPERTSSMDGTSEDGGISAMIKCRECATHWAIIAAPRVVVITWVVRNRCRMTWLTRIRMSGDAIRYSRASDTFDQDIRESKGYTAVGISQWKLGGKVLLRR